MLGEASPDHTQPSTARTIRVAVVWLALWLLPVAAVAAVAGPGNVYTSIAVFFSKMALVTFGGAYAVLAYVAQQAVSHYHWVTPGEMLDGLGHGRNDARPPDHGVAIRGLHGGLPFARYASAAGGRCSRWTARDMGDLHTLLSMDIRRRSLHRKLRGNKALSGALSAITAAVVGVILNLAIWFAIHALFRATRHISGFGLSFDAPVPASLNVWSLVLALGAAIAIFRFKIGMIPTLAASCAAGVVLYALGLVTPL